MGKTLKWNTLGDVYYGITTYWESQITLHDWKTDNTKKKIKIKIKMHGKHYFKHK